jgi:PBP1b-binding outer membrane lipoprotein LpoB
MKRVIGIGSLILLLMGCQAMMPHSNYKEQKSLPENSQSQNIINVCRDGALADKLFLKLYFDSEYVAIIPVSFVSKSRFKINYATSVNSITVRQPDEKVVARLSVTNKTPKDLYLLITSETSKFVPIPLPGLIVTQSKGTRKIESVSKSTFDEVCGNVGEVILSK